VGFRSVKLRRCSGSCTILVGSFSFQVFIARLLLNLVLLIPRNFSVKLSARVRVCVEVWADVSCRRKRIFLSGSWRMVLES
jgi:hypothetical protein